MRTGIQQIGGLLALLVSAQYSFAQFQIDCSAPIICFEPESAFVHGVEDIQAFVLAEREALGLTGTESLSCTRRSWIEFVDDGFPNFAYRCEQTEVQGLEAVGFILGIYFWSDASDVRYVRCFCIAEDQILPTPIISGEEAASRARRYVLGHHPPTAPDDITQIREPSLALQRRLPNLEDPFSLIWRVRLRFPGIRDPRWAKLSLSVDTQTSNVIRVYDLTDIDLFLPWVPMDDQLSAQMAQSPESEELFHRYQEYSSFLGLGEAEAERQRAQIDSLALWEAEHSSQFIVYFLRRMNMNEVASLIRGYSLNVSRLRYMYPFEGEMTYEFLKVDPASDSVSAADIRAFALTKRRIAERGRTDRILAGLGDVEAIRFDMLDIELNHLAAKRFWSRERNRRLLALVPLNDYFPPTQ